MATPRPWTDQDTTTLRHLHGTGQSLHAIAAQMNRSKSTVSAKAKGLGLTFDRDRAVRATQARVADAKARRAQLKADLLEDAARLRKQLWEPHTYFEWGGKDHTYAETTINEPTPTDKLKLVQAVSQAIGSYDRLEKLDGDGGVADAVGMLDKIADAIKATAEQLQAHP